MARPAGVEPAAFGFGGQRSIHLSYGREAVPRSPTPASGQGLPGLRCSGPPFDGEPTGTHVRLVSQDVRRNRGRHATNATRVTPAVVHPEYMLRPLLHGRTVLESRLGIATPLWGTKVGMTNSVLVLPDDDPEPPLNLNGVRPFLICCDESGMHKANFYGFGTLWLPYDRRGDFYDGIRRICAQHHMNFGVVNDKKHEFKWSKVSPQKLGFYQSIVDYFFERPELCFHCLVVRRAEVKLELHKGGYEEARQKHLTM